MAVSAANDVGAFEDFFRAEYPRLVPMLQAVTGDRQWAEDVAQEALVAAQQNWERIARFDKPGAWVRRVALNRSSNVRRRRRRESAALERFGPGGSTAEEIDGDDSLWRLVRRLPDQQRWAVALYYVEDRSVADVATILGCTAGTVKTHLSRARESLARELEAHG
jgi:RNA polymerase sigma-70 factor, ECF subfamily